MNKEEAIEWIKLMTYEDWYDEFCLECKAWHNKSNPRKHNYDDKSSLSHEIEGFETDAVIKFLRYVFNIPEEVIGE